MGRINQNESQLKAWPLSEKNIFSFDIAQIGDDVWLLKYGILAQLYTCLRSKPYLFVLYFNIVE